MQLIHLQIIDLLLDVERTPRKPQYKMAPEIPLVLQSCEFEGLRFICSSGNTGINCLCIAAPFADTHALYTLKVLYLLACLTL